MIMGTTFDDEEEDDDDPPQVPREPTLIPEHWDRLTAVYVVDPTQDSYRRVQLFLKRLHRLERPKRPQAFVVEFQLQFRRTHILGVELLLLLYELLARTTHANDRTNRTVDRLRGLFILLGV